MDSKINELFEKVKFGDVASSRSTTQFVAKTRKHYTKITKTKISENDVFVNIRKNEFKTGYNIIKSGVKFIKKCTGFVSANTGNRVVPMDTSESAKPKLCNNVFQRKEIVMQKDSLGFRADNKVKNASANNEQAVSKNTRRNADAKRRQSFGIKVKGSRIHKNIKNIKRSIFMKSVAVGGVEMANRILGINKKSTNTAKIEVKHKGFSFGKPSIIGIPKVNMNDAMIENNNLYGDENKPLAGNLDELVDMLGLIENKLQTCHMEDLRQICLLERQTKFLLRRIDENDLV